ncbi:phosphatase PAP2 family protein [Sphingomonas sp. ASV193]|uniref:phosphatase PAP2 family protein n=1 Tax=Sphingomonas sp. ASV193 TaxID=3144405 RepID=UPI0032E8E882
MRLSVLLRPASIFAVLVVIVLAGLLGGPGTPVDTALVRGFEHWRLAHPGPTQAMIWLTLVGGAPLSLSALAIGAMALWFRAKPRWAGALVAAGLGERVAVEILKRIVNRPRPQFDPHPVATYSQSFPSAHAANSMTALLLVALLVVAPSKRGPAVVAAVATSLLIGLSRIYLGVHWPSDVLAGWAIGILVATLAVVVGARASAAAEEEHEVVGGHRAPLDQR